MAFVRGYSEYLKTRTFLAVRSFAQKRSGNMCEFCGCRPGEDIHHKDNRYPPIKWGEWAIWDVPSSVAWICRECHCKAHGKES